MTIDDLNWRPTAVGGGFVATHRFANGIIVHVQCVAITPTGESYRAVTTGSDRRIIDQRNGIGRSEVNRFLSATESRA